MARPIKVFIQGSFDLFHYGHVRAIARAKELGDELIVGLNTDRLYRSYKKKVPVIKYSYRRKVLEALRDVDRVVPVNMLNPLSYLKAFRIDIYVVCQEWLYNKQKEVEYMRQIGGKVIVLPYLKGVSSNGIRHKMIKNHVNHNVRLCKKCHRKL